MYPPMSIVEFGDLKDSPSVHIPLPAPIPIGTRVQLALTLHRRNGTRTEELKVEGDYRVAAVSISVKGGQRQQVVLESLGKAPAWRAVRNNREKKLPPARAPRKVVT
jgi:hypothetical protein